MHPFWTKKVAKYTEGIFPLCLAGEGAEHGAEIDHTGVE
jgi:hypothetical protein